MLSTLIGHVFSILNCAGLARFQSQRAVADRPINTTTTNPLSDAAPDHNIIAAVAPLLSRIKTTYGFDDPTFECHVLPVVSGLARYVHELPAAPDGPYRGAGGALRMALEIGLYSLQAADGRTFGCSDVTPSSHLRHAWRLASLLAGMFVELHHMLSRVEVVNEYGEIWPIGCCPLSEWLTETESQRYNLRWKETPIDARALGVHLASQLIPPKVLDYLGKGNASVVPQLFSCIAGATNANEKSILAEVVHRTVAAIVDRNGSNPRVSRLEHPLQTMADDIDSCTPSPAKAVTAKPLAKVETCDLLASDERRNTENQQSNEATESSVVKTIEENLQMDFSGIANPIVRDSIERIMQRVNTAFNTVRARIQDDGIFVAISEFDSTLSDTSTLIRALADAELLQVGSGEHGKNRKVQTLQMDGEAVSGIVIRRSKLTGWDCWVERWSVSSNGGARLSRRSTQG